MNRNILAACSACLTLLCNLGIAEAGLYNPSEPLFSQLQLRMNGPADFPSDYKLFLRFVLDPLRGIAGENPLTNNPLRLRYRVVTDSAESFKARGWPFLEQLSLSEYMLRRGNSDEAKRLLENLRGEKHSFLALANLGSAEQLAKDYRKAALYLNQGFEAWPKSWEEASKELRTQFGAMRWGRADFDWYRKVEGYHVKLADLRSQEIRNNPDSENVDALFGDFFAFDPKDAYHPGKPPTGRASKLPEDALPIVQQLLVWFPNDQRLLWLAAEILNAQGDVPGALEIFNDLAGINFSAVRYRPALLLRHRAILAEAPRPAATLPTIAPPPPPEDPAPPEVNLVDWRSLGVGFGAGMVFAFILYWQIREITRRRSKARAD